MVRKIAVLGCTGSVGTSTLDLIEQGERSGRLAVKVTALAAGRNVERLAEQAKRW
ncbi:1-deoxy-D-xylulose-5-phosphate reductoisomerase, partial [Bacillus halotolerans]|nr:1-deoxy-D-xylulose-5-phosphate reductoisomerase [Bacillus halotolerans]